MAPFELTLYSFLDAQGVEQEFNTPDHDAALAHAAWHNLVILENTYEFVTSAPIADFTTCPTVIAGN